MPLTSPLLLVLVAVLAEALIFLAVNPRAHRDGWVRAGCGTLAAVLLVAGGGAWANDHYGLYRSWRDLLGVHSRDLVALPAHQSARVAVAALSPVAHARRGTLLQVVIPGTASGVAPRPAFVYLPPQYRDPVYAGERFPVVEAFQGSPGRPSDWVLGLHIDQELDRAIGFGTVRPAIVVIPDTNGGLARSLECANTRDGKNDETFLVQDVRRWVTSTLRALPGRWVGIGYSTGGYCALDLAVRHPTAYASAASLDGYAHAIADRYARGVWHGPQDRREHSPDWWVGHHRPEPVDLYLLAGRDDRDSITAATSFWAALGRTGWRRPHDALVAQPRGRHTFPAWQAALAPALEWALPGVNAPHGSSLVYPVPSFATFPVPRPSRRPTHSPSARPTMGQTGPTPRPRRSTACSPAASCPAPRPSVSRSP